MRNAVFDCKIVAENMYGSEVTLLNKKYVLCDYVPCRHTRTILDLVLSIH